MVAPRECLWCLSLVCLLAMPGCRVKMRAGFDSPDPQERAIALVRTSRSRDTQSIPDLIGALDSADPAARLLAIKALEYRTEETFGYRYFDPPWVREEAVERWVAWWAGQTDEQHQERVAVPEQ